MYNRWIEKKKINKKNQLWRSKGHHFCHPNLRKKPQRWWVWFRLSLSPFEPILSFIIPYFHLSKKKKKKETFNVTYFASLPSSSLFLLSSLFQPLSIFFYSGNFPFSLPLSLHVNVLPFPSLHYTYPFLWCKALPSLPPSHLPLSVSLPALLYYSIKPSFLLLSVPHLLSSSLSSSLSCSRPPRVQGIHQMRIQLKSRLLKNE